MITGWKWEQDCSMSIVGTDIYYRDVRLKVDKTVPYTVDK
jgi:hypothetical protein